MVRTDDRAAREGLHGGIGGSLLYRAFFRLVLQHVDPERAHSLVAASLRLLGRVPGAPALLALLLGPRGEGLRVRAFGLDFRTPLGVAAGLDKDATFFGPLIGLGFGAVEVGTVTARPQPGNERPRVSRFPAQRALLNAMGFPSDGAARVAARLATRRPRGVLGVNVGKTRVVELGDAVPDYRASVRRLAPLAGYLVLNVSSPNTPGLAQMQAVERLAALVDGVREELAAGGWAVPLLVKVGPDLPDAELERVAEMAVERRLDGIVATNTTTDLGGLPAAAVAAAGHGGGVSGAPLKARATEVLRLLHAKVGGRAALVAVGGIETPEDAWERILAGATLVQAYTGFVYGGPLWPRRMNRGLERLLRESEWSSIAEAVGKGASESSHTLASHL